MPDVMYAAHARGGVMHDTSSNIRYQLHGVGEHWTDKTRDRLGAISRYCIVDIGVGQRLLCPRHAEYYDNYNVYRRTKERD